MGDESILHNIRVLDFTWVLAGPYATRLLADYGAVVIKVQPPRPGETEDEFSRGYHNTWNRNKLGIRLNLNKPEGIALVRRLVGICDVVAENFTPRVMANWGLDYKNLKKIKPDIIMLSLSAMGHKGPRRNYTGYAPTVHALSGLTGLVSSPGGPPLGPGFAYADHAAGLYGSLAVLGALERRRRTGKGRHIDLSEVDVMRSLLDAESFQLQGNASSEAAPHNVYPCRGGRWCSIAVSTDAEWQALRKAMGDPTWAEDEKYVSVSGRLERRDELDALISTWTKRHTAAVVMKKLRKHGVTVGVVQDAADLARNPLLKTRGFFIDRPDIGKLVDASPMRLSASEAVYRRGAPAPGQDNDYVLSRLLGLSPAEIARLSAEGVI
jgi:crotonobetainyl-CoA:carnitine CoA-transferase CaiB-like acyl-CoA transferase